MRSALVATALAACVTSGMTAAFEPDGLERISLFDTFEPAIWMSGAPSDAADELGALLTLAFNLQSTPNYQVDWDIVAAAAARANVPIPDADNTILGPEARMAQCFNGALDDPIRGIAAISTRSGLAQWKTGCASLQAFLGDEANLLRVLAKAGSAHEQVALVNTYLHSCAIRREIPSPQLLGEVVLALPSLDLRQRADDLGRSMGLAGVEPDVAAAAAGGLSPLDRRAVESMLREGAQSGAAQRNGIYSVVTTRGTELRTEPFKAWHAFLHAATLEDALREVNSFLASGIVSPRRDPSLQRAGVPDPVYSATLLITQIVERLGSLGAAEADLRDFLTHSRSYIRDGGRMPIDALVAYGLTCGPRPAEADNALDLAYREPELTDWALALLAAAEARRGNADIALDAAKRLLSTLHSSHDSDRFYVAILAREPAFRPALRDVLVSDALARNTVIQGIALAILRDRGGIHREFGLAPHFLLWPVPHDLSFPGRMTATEIAAAVQSAGEHEAAQSGPQRELDERIRRAWPLVQGKFRHSGTGATYCPADDAADRPMLVFFTSRSFEYVSHEARSDQYLRDHVNALRAHYPDLVVIHILDVHLPIEVQPARLTATQLLETISSRRREQVPVEALAPTWADRTMVLVRHEDRSNLRLGSVLLLDGVPYIVNSSLHFRGTKRELFAVLIEPDGRERELKAR